MVLGARVLAVLAVGLAALVTPAAPVVHAAPVIRSASGPNAAAITPSRDQFRVDLGGGNVAGANGSFGGVRREINWDGTPDGFSAPNNLPGNFFNVNSPRGVVFTTPGSGFQVSANAGIAPVEFGTLDPSYPGTFGVFSPQKLFTPIGSNIVDVTFFAPGTNRPATVRGFGSVFTDVDLANTTSMEFFNANNVSLGVHFVPNLAGSETMSFLGVSFNAGERVSRVRITNGNIAVGGGVTDQNGATRDIVVMDDFLYSEPQAIQRLYDFDGDTKADPGIYRPTNPQGPLWYAPNSGGGGAFQIYFGLNGDIHVPGDYSGDGVTDAAIYRPTTGLWYGVRTGVPGIVIQEFFGGAPGDVPVPCDYDGDNKTDPAFFRPSNGQVLARLSNGGIFNTFIGQAGDIPYAADFNADGKCEPGVMRSGVGPGGTNLWYAPFNGTPGVFQIFFGLNGDVPMPGDYDGDARADAVIYRPTTGLWYGPKTNGTTIVVQEILGGQAGDVPIAADYDGDGTMDVAFFRPAATQFFAHFRAGGILNTSFGAPSDTPIQKRTAP